MSVEEYLRTSFEGEREYLDGEAVDRNTGLALHGEIMGRLASLLWSEGRVAGLKVLLIIRIKFGENRYRVPDVAAWRKDVDLGEIPDVLPFLAIEVLSPDDQPARMSEKVQEFLGAGTEWLWVVDPYKGHAMVYSRQNPLGESVTVLRTENPAIELPLEKVLDRQM